MKEYKLIVTIKEGSDEFWDQLNETQETGCDVILEQIKTALDDNGLDCTVKLISFTDTE